MLISVNVGKFARKREPALEKSWTIHLKHFANYLKLERSLSDNSIEAYVHDVTLLHQFVELQKLEIGPMKISAKHLQTFLHYINELGMSAHSQARILSGVKGFF